MLKKYFSPTLLIFLVLLIWHKTLFQTFLGEGFFYFDRAQSFFLGLNINHLSISGIWEYDNFAKIIFPVLIPVFGYNLQLYQGFQLLIIVILTLVFYKFINYFTHNSWVGFTGAVIFSTSYLGLFEMIGDGQYDRLVQRIPNQILLLISFIQLAKFFESKNIKNYLYSLITFTIAVFLAHFSTFWLPIFILYPIIYSLCQKKKVHLLVNNIAFSTPFVLTNLFLISRDAHTPDGSFVSFVHSHGLGNLVKQMLLQFSNMTLPPVLIEKIASITSSYESTIIILTLPIIAIIIGGIFLVAKRSKESLPIYLLSIFSLPILLFLSLFLGKVNAIYNMRGYTYYFLPKVYSIDSSLTASLKGDRYYMMPYFFLAIIIAILISTLFQKKLIYGFVTVIFLVSYVSYNYILVNNNIDKIQPVSEDMKKYLLYINSISNKLSDKSIIIIPREFLWPSVMIRSRYHYPNMVFLPADSDWKKQVSATDYQNVLQINFYYDKTKDGKINSPNNHIITFEGKQ